MLERRKGIDGFIPLKEHEIIKISLQLANAFYTMDKFNYVHGQINPNIIFFSNKESLQIKLGGLFHSGINIDNNKPDNKGFFAPEFWNSVRSTKSDIWSLGILFYFMIFLELPFGGYTQNTNINPQRLFKEWNKNSIIERFSNNFMEGYKVLLQGMLTLLHPRRSSIKTILGMYIYI